MRMLQVEHLVTAVSKSSISLTLPTLLMLVLYLLPQVRNVNLMVLMHSSLW